MDALRIRKRWVGAVAIVLIGMIGLWLAAFSPSRGQAAIGATAQDALQQKAQQFATNNDDTSPLAGLGVQTTLLAAVNLLDPGDQVLPNDAAAQAQVVYAVQLTGSFTGLGAKVPNGAAAPKGAVLWFITDTSYTVLGWGLTGSSQDLSKLGPTFPISQSKR